MGITEKAVRNPAAVAVAVAIVALFGLFCLSQLPLQLFPEIESPRINVNANWRAASPKEVESEILEPMEDVLQGLPGLEIMESNAFNGGAWIGMEFALGTDMQATLMDVIGRLNRLPPLPADADPPVVNMGGGDANQALSWFFVQLKPGTEGPVERYAAYVEDTVRPRLESIPGVAGVELNAGAPEELQITIDPYRAAEFGIPLGTVAAQAGRSNDVSGGFVDVGRRQYTLRFEGRYDPEQLKNRVLEWRDGRPIRLGDIADVRIDRGKKQFIAIQNGNPAMGLRVDRANGANVLATLTEVKAAVAELRDGPLAAKGLDIQQSFDASVFINRAVGMVRNNLLLGVLLAVGVLWWFLRDRRATLLIASAIPISLLATFIVLKLTGRSLNVISLAGLAFAVGMVLDAAIVVSENIVRLRERGEMPGAAALLGTQQVKGALLASTATTVAIFLPVLFLEDVEGQLFADLALTIAIAVVISLVVAVTVLPTVAGNWLKARRLSRDNDGGRWGRLAGWLMKTSATPTRRVVLIASLIGAPLLVSWALFPQLDYLPPVKRDAVDAFLQFPPGSNVETNEREVVNTLVERLQPYMDGEKQPALKNYYILTWPGGGTIGARVLDQDRVRELETIVREEVLTGIPDFRGFAQQGNLFGGFGGGRDIAVHLQSADEAGLYAAAGQAQTELRNTFPGANVQARPEIETASPELRILPNDDRINEVGMDRQQVASLVRMLGNGLWLGEHFDGESRKDIIMRAGGWETPEQLATTPVTTPSGEVVPLGELVQVARATGPGQVRRVNGRRTISVNLSPPEDVSLETAIATIRAQAEPGMRAALPADGSIQYGGSADSLSQAIGTMGRNFLMALGILFLLMAGLFRSLKDSALVVLTIPLAGVGGIVALRALNLVTFQPMDLLTMIGFIILLGLVVNNAILLVDRTRAAEREGMARDEAVAEALKMRLRPIFMSTFTSIFGMLPLLLLPGQGSVIYRGLAAAIVGGMVFSLFFTLLLLPALLRLGKAKPASDEATSAATAPALESVA
ncbi:efflux RND transporter permease subunit [Marinihelvus fidelis]|uniref:Efflux RND transporter permease subunit n=1 Tax=Marinihelvus fidelis TaxID=2613842 RepID=A0A5N0TDC0_9GAMM|nr:efflux RND transporter permease subunit [Marinihelvus fidelis]KAA9131289.1 efflux RND transporter permease subunit [Marinihelvus fidelis]